MPSTTFTITGMSWVRYVTRTAPDRETAGRVVRKRATMAHFDYEMRSRSRSAIPLERRTLGVAIQNLEAVQAEHCTCNGGPGTGDPHAIGCPAG